MSTLIEPPYTAKWLKKKLIEHYDDGIVICNMKGCKDVVYLQEGANKLLFEFYQQSKDKKKGTDKDGAKSVTEKATDH